MTAKDRVLLADGERPRADTVVVTASIPWGEGEQFIFAELDALEALGHRVLVVPVKPILGRAVPNGTRYRDRALGWPMLSWRYLPSAGYWAARRPIITGRCVWNVLRHSGGARKAIKNLAVLPKSFHVAKYLAGTEVQHIHAHWLSTSATLAMTISALTDLPWSVTAHRWDIADRNLLQQKVASAKVVRVISRDGERELRSYLENPQQAAKIMTIHMGVRIPPVSLLRTKPERREPVVMIPANLVEKKGHRVLLDALARVAARGEVGFHLLIAGDGHLREAIRDQIAHLGLKERVTLLGKMPHEELTRRYRDGEVDIVVLPSIVTDNGEREGIPVSLMEAMAAGIAVIATPTGGTEELVGGAGLIVPERDAAALAAGLEHLLGDAEERERIARSGRQRVVSSFSAEACMRRLTGCWAGARDVRLAYPGEAKRPATSPKGARHPSLATAPLCETEVDDVVRHVDTAVDDATPDSYRRCFELTIEPSWRVLS